MKCECRMIHHALRARKLVLCVSTGMKGSRLNQRERGMLTQLASVPASDLISSVRKDSTSSSSVAERNSSSDMWRPGDSKSTADADLDSDEVESMSNSERGEREGKEDTALRKATSDSLSPVVLGSWNGEVGADGKSMGAGWRGAEGGGVGRA